MMLILQDSGIGTYADIQLTILRSLTEELHMSAVKKVITSAYKYFFISVIYNLLLFTCFSNRANLQFFAEIKAHCRVKETKEPTISIGF